MLKKPFSKIVGYLSALTTLVAATSHESLVSTLDNVMPVAFADPVAHVVLGVCVLITLFSHSANGAGGASSPNAPKSLTSNLMKR
jgi:hypothetical protein